MVAPMRVLMITSVWPTPAHPERAPFIVRQVESLRARGVEVDVLHVDGGGRPGNYARRWREVRALTAARSFDLVHAQWGQSALVALPRRAPLVVTFRGSDLEGIAGHPVAGGILRWMSRLAARQADQVVVVSASLARHIPFRHCHVIPSGLDLELFRPMPQADARATLGLHPSRRYVLFAASPANPVKRHELAAAAVASLQAPDVELLVATGVRPAEMPIYMSACDLLLLTSQHEGSPNVVKEALACNLPVVAVDVGDVRTRISEVEGCVVCADDGVGTVAAALESVLRRGQRVAGRDAVLDLDEARLTDRLIEVYRQALDGRRQSTRRR
jgi:teichuronic acid biosynthesis glycosyltransferase TuaC